VYFIAGIYILDNDLPRWLLDVASVLPARPLAVALQFVPRQPRRQVRRWARPRRAGLGRGRADRCRAPVLLRAAPG